MQVKCLWFLIPQDTHVHFLMEEGFCIPKDVFKDGKDFLWWCD